MYVYNTWNNLFISYCNQLFSVPTCVRACVHTCMHSGIHAHAHVYVHLFVHYLFSSWYCNYML